MYEGRATLNPMQKIRDLTKIRKSRVYSFADAKALITAENPVIYVDGFQRGEWVFKGRCA